MDIGSFALLIVILLAIGGLGWALFGFLGVSGKRAEMSESATSDDPEANARFEKGERPEHTRVRDRGDQTFIGS